jgi:hypothetical protein
LRICIVGVNHWDDVTFPFWKQLTDRNPEAQVIVVDNGSEPPYPMLSAVRVNKTIGYGSAINLAAFGKWEWLLACNNDCVCNGKVDVSGLDDGTVYGNAWKFDYEWSKDLGLPAVVDSAYLLIPRRVWDKVGEFDPLMDAAFEEIDYSLRVIQAGFRVDVADLPILHLNLHTRYELLGYNGRWQKTSSYFRDKYSLRSENGKTQLQSKEETK